VTHAFAEEVLVPDQRERHIRQLAREHGLFLGDIEKIRKTFDQFDENGSGFIDRLEFKEVMLVLMKVQNPQDLSDKMLDRYWHEVDNNFSGSVSFEEFLMWFTLYFDPSV